jgi:hypothetical protein
MGSLQIAAGEYPYLPEERGVPRTMGGNHKGKRNPQAPILERGNWSRHTTELQARGRADDPAP